MVNCRPDGTALCLCLPLISLPENRAGMSAGEFQDGWTDSREMATFTVLYLLVLFLLVLNFLLAIIVEAYMQLREDIAAKQVNLEMVSPHEP